MYEKLHGIVLYIIKYNDKNSIVHMLTREKGRVAFLLSQGTGKSIRMRNALFMPLSILEFEGKFLPGRELNTIKEVRPVEVHLNIGADPIKNAIAMFMAELVGKTVRGNEDSDLVYEYVATAIRILDSQQGGIANFHICFLYRLGVLLGIQPDMGSFRPGYAFDMREGMFVPYTTTEVHIIPPAEASAIVMLDRMRFGNIHRFKYNRVQRNRILDMMLRYYQIHSSTMSGLKSPEILMQLFT